MKYSHNYVIKSQNHDKIITIFVYHLELLIMTIKVIKKLSNLVALKF